MALLTIPDDEHEALIPLVPAYMQGGGKAAQRCRWAIEQVLAKAKTDKAYEEHIERSKTGPVQP